MKVRNSVFLAITLALTAQFAGAQTPEKKLEVKSPKSEATAAKPAVPAKPATSPAPKPTIGNPQPATAPSPNNPITQSPSPTPNTQHPTPTATVTTPKGESINITVNAAPPETPKSNNWAAGVIGMAVLAGLGFFGWRFAQKRGLTVPDALKKMGVEMPQDGAAQGARPLRPVAPTEPPLPSLAALPAAGIAAGAVMTAPSAPSAVAAARYSGPPRLVGIEGPFAGETLDLDQSFTVGREADNVLALTQDATVSRHHATVERQNSVWVVRDNESSNGTYLNGVRIDGAKTLQSGDEIQIGATRLRFEGQG